jgi:hypothetical protein
VAPAVKRRSSEAHRLKWRQWSDGTIAEMAENLEQIRYWGRQSSACGQRQEIALVHRLSHHKTLVAQNQRKKR